MAIKDVAVGLCMYSQVSNLETQENSAWAVARRVQKAKVFCWSTVLAEEKWKNVRRHSVGKKL